MEPIFSKALDYLLQNFRILLEAPVVFIAVLLLSFFGSYWLIGLRFQGTIDAKTSTIENLKARIDALQTKIVDIEPQNGAKGATPKNLTSARDPDGVFQLGSQVGTVQLPQIDESRGIVAFGSIVGAVKFNIDKDFEYRDYVLHVKSFEKETRASIAGDVKRGLYQVTCEIIERKTRD